MHTYRLQDNLTKKKHKQSFEFILHILPYPSAVQFPCCCKLDHKILLAALGAIQAIATKAPKKLKSRSVTVAIATPKETTVNESA